MSEKTKISSKKLIILISTILLLLVAVAGLATAFVINYNGFTPKAPIVLEDGKNVFISTELNNNYNGYRFKFVCDGEEFVFDGEENVLSSDFLLDNGLELGKTYNISTCYLDKKSGNNSEYSKETTWTFCDYLSAPVVVYDEEKNTIEWEAVENADFYRVYYNGGEEAFVDIEELFVNLKDFDCGERVFTIFAYSNFDYYKPSLPSQNVEVEIIRYLENFTSITFDYNAKTITAKAPEKFDEVMIMLGAEPYELTLQDEPQLVGEEYVYIINIETLYDNEELIGIYPKDKDKYNKYDGTSIKYCEVKIPETEEGQ